MAERIRFHLDESVDLGIAGGLRRRGVEVTTTQEVGLLGKTDQEQLAFARAEKRALVTHDRDFLVLHRQGVAHSGLFYCRRQERSIGQILRTLILAWELLSPEEMEKELEFL